MQVLRHFLEAFRQRSRPQEQLVHAARLLILPMLEQGFASNQAIVEADMLNTMVADMFDPPDDLASKRPSSVTNSGVTHVGVLAHTSVLGLVRQGVIEGKSYHSVWTGSLM